MADLEQIWHVDENDHPIGPIGRDDSRRTGARYRIVRVSVEDSDGNVLLQKRLGTKKTYPGCWDTSAGGNIAYGETYQAAAERELYEEVGIKDVSIEEQAYFYGEVVDPAGNKMNRFTKVYRAVVPRAIRVTPQPEEVAELCWVTREELATIVAEGNITDGLKQTAQHYYGIATS